MSELLATIFKFLLGVLALVGLAIAVERAFAADHTGDASREISEISTNVRQLYNGSVAANYTGVTNASLINAGVIPSEMTNGDGTSIAGPWQGSTVTITAQNSSTWMALWTNVPASACARFAKSVSSIGVTINGHLVGMGDTTNISADCAGATASTMNFFFAN